MAKKATTKKKTPKATIKKGHEIADAIARGRRTSAKAKSARANRYAIGAAAAQKLALKRKRKRTPK